MRLRWLSPTSLLTLLLLCGATAPACGGSQAQPPPEAEPKPATEQTASAPDPAPEKAEPIAEAEPPPPADPWGPITEAQDKILWAGEEEARINTPEHYVKTNERRHDVWFPYIADKRGIYVGVAADQNYTLMAVAKAEFAFLIDLDWRVTELHRCYEVLIEASHDSAYDPDTRAPAKRERPPSIQGLAFAFQKSLGSLCSCVKLESGIT